MDAALVRFVRLPILTLALASLALSEESLVGSEEATISRSTQLFSGPGDEYFPTEPIEEGAIVEIFRARGDWLAVRPTPGSYSWVDRRLIRELSPVLAEVTADGATSRLGSSIHEARTVYQVRLKRGEKVALLGQTDGRWVKIAPPSGEFRWVKRANVALLPNSPLAEQSVPSGLGEVNYQSTAEETNPLNKTGGIAADAHLIGGGDTAFSPLEGLKNQTPFRAPAGDADFGRELDAIDLAIAETLLLSRDKWRLDELANRAKIVARTAEDAAQRGKAEILAERVARLKRVQMGYTYLAMALESSPGGNDRRASREGRQVPDSESYDGVGRLRPVLASRGSTSKYALENDQGQVVCYVTPPAGSDLSRYTGQRVGVRGRKGFVPQLNARHVQAESIAILPEPLLRR